MRVGAALHRQAGGLFGRSELGERSRLFEIEPCVVEARSVRAEQVSALLQQYLCFGGVAGIELGIGEEAVGARAEVRVLAGLEQLKHARRALRAAPPWSWLRVMRRERDQ